MGEILKRISSFKLNPPRILTLGFGSLILIGTILLNLPIASESGKSIGFINALFTSASAVCVTGLVVVNTAEFWSLFGKIVILILIQMGGLGIMTMATAGALIIGKRITLKERMVIKEQLNQKSMSGLVRLTIYVLLSTFLIEGIGAVLLSIRFIPIYGLGKGIWFSIFHSVSAFCNAGFDITGNSMVPFAGDISVNIIISLLVIIGGIGFSVLIDVTKNKKIRKFNLHTKMVLTITGLLLVIGMVSFLIIEFNNPSTIGNMSGINKVVTSFFQSVVPRTAGFNSVDMGNILDTTTFFMIILMFIGGSPGSTAGGVKTTTIGTLILTTISIIKGERDVAIYKRRISEDVINRALAIIVVSMILVIVVASVLTITEEFIFIDVLFETTSAFATVGLSRGITPNLSSMGKIIITLTMYAGRVGPLTMAFAFAQKNKAKKYRYAEGNIIVG